MSVHGQDLGTPNHSDLQDVFMNTPRFFAIFNSCNITQGVVTLRSRAQIQFENALVKALQFAKRKRHLLSEN